MKIRTRFLSIAAILLAASVVQGGLESRTREILQAGGLTNASFSVMAVDLSNNQTLIAINPDEPMIPASNMKLITTAAALNVLGPDFMFETRLLLADGGVLVVRGDGDPGFADPKLMKKYGTEVKNVEQLLEAWVAAVANAAPKQLNRLAVDDRIFDDQFVHPTWPRNQLNNWYCAQVAGLNFFDNCLMVYVSPTVTGESPHVQMVPHVPDLETFNRARTGKRNRFGIDRTLDTNHFTFHGEVHRRTAPHWVTVHDPPLLFGRILADRITQGTGIKVAMVDRATAEDRFANAKVLHRVRTHMALVLERCNKHSQNLFAEALLKRMGRHYTGTRGGWLNGAAAVRAFLSQRALGPAAASVTIADGSGLSRDNRITARILVKLLAHMHADKQRGEPFKNSLPVGGGEGSLAKRFTRNIHAKVLGKTGWIKGVGALSGYLEFPAATAPGGAESSPRTVAYCILINDSPLANSQMKRLQDRIVRLIDEAVVLNNRHETVADN